MKKEIEIYSEPYPSCCHLKGQTCSLLSNAVGRQAGVTTAFCNKVCHGGEGAKDAKTFDGMVVAARSTWKAQHGGERFLSRVLRSYKNERAVRVPQWWEEARAELAPLYAFTSVTSINLSGSAIYGDLPEHDIDLVVHLDSFENLTPEFLAALPTTLLGKKCDTFLRHDWYGLFPQLDCERKILHVPTSFPMERQVEEGITVVAHEDDPEFKYIIEQIKSEPVPTPAPAPLPPAPEPLPKAPVQARATIMPTGVTTPTTGCTPCAKQQALREMLAAKKQAIKDRQQNVVQ